MASYSKTTPTALADELICMVGVGASSQNNVTGNSSGKLYVLEVDNTRNTNLGIYFNIADASSATVGTTVPTFRLYIPAGKKSSLTWAEGHSYSSGLSVWASVTKTTTRVEGPSSNVVAKMLVTS